MDHPNGLIHFGNLADSNSINGIFSRNSTPNPTMHSHERLATVSFLMGGNDVDPSRPQAGNSTHESFFEGLSDLNSAHGGLEPLCSRPSTPNPNMNSHERVPPVLGVNDVDPSRPQVGNSSHGSSCSVSGQLCLDLNDKVDNLEDPIENGEEMARYKTADSGNHVIEQDPANTNTQPALQHEPNALGIKHGFDEDIYYETKSVEVGSSYDPVKRPKKDDQWEKIQEFAKAGKTMDVTADEMKVSVATVKRCVAARGTSWRQIKKGGKQSSSSANNTNPAGHDYRPQESSHGGPVCRAISNSIPDEEVGEEDDINDDDELDATKHLKKRAVKASFSPNSPNVMFDFIYTGTPSLRKLEYLVASNLKAYNLEPGGFKLKYKVHKPTEWILMLEDSHLDKALSLSKESDYLLLQVHDFYGTLKSLPKGSK